MNVAKYPNFPYVQVLLFVIKVHCWVDVRGNGFPSPFWSLLARRSGCLMKFFLKGDEIPGNRISEVWDAVFEEELRKTTLTGVLS